MTTAREALIHATQRLQASGIDSARTDAELLLCHVLECTRFKFALIDELTYGQRMSYERLLSKRQSRVPLQHLTGIAPFRYLELEIGPGALVPRPETEVVVEAALRWVRANATSRPLLLDLCSGAAPITVALATELEHVDVVGIEKYEDAQAWGRRNAVKYAQAVAARDNTLTLADGDATDAGLFAPYEGRAAAVISNPPYIPDGMVPRDPEVRQHDPKEALFGGVDGFDIVRGLLDTAAMALQDNGYFIMEHADAQGEEAGELSLPTLVRAHGAYAKVEDHCDLTGRPRYTTAIRIPR